MSDFSSRSLLCLRQNWASEVNNSGKSPEILSLVLLSPHLLLVVSPQQRPWSWATISPSQEKTRQAPHKKRTNQIYGNCDGREKAWLFPWKCSLPVWISNVISKFWKYLLKLLPGVYFALFNKTFFSQCFFSWLTHR